MKIVDDWLERIGTDKVLHFLVGGMMTALGALFGTMGYFIALLGAAELSVLKECLDDDFSFGDISAALLGCGVSGLIYAVSVGV